MAPSSLLFVYIGENQVNSENMHDDNRDIKFCTYEALKYLSCTLGLVRRDSRNGFRREKYIREQEFTYQIPLPKECNFWHCFSTLTINSWDHIQRRLS